jgi:hypothetical protein
MKFSKIFIIVMTNAMYECGEYFSNIFRVIKTEQIFSASLARENSFFTCAHFNSIFASALQLTLMVIYSIFPQSTVTELGGRKKELIEKKRI